MTSVDVAAIRARADEDRRVVPSPAQAHERLRLVYEDRDALLSALGVAEARAQEAEAALERVKALVTAATSPERQRAGMTYVPSAVLLAALHGVPSQPPTTQGDHT